MDIGTISCQGIPSTHITESLHPLPYPLSTCSPLGTPHLELLCGKPLHSIASQLHHLDTTIMSDTVATIMSDTAGTVMSDTVATVTRSHRVGTADHRVGTAGHRVGTIRASHQPIPVRAPQQGLRATSHALGTMQGSGHTDLSSVMSSSFSSSAWLSAAVQRLSVTYRGKC